MPSQEYFDRIAFNRQLIESGKQHIGRSMRYRFYLKQIVSEVSISTAIDWGCGLAKQWKISVPEDPNNTLLQQWLGIADLKLYDPGVPDYDQYPDETPYDLVICTDVLSLIPEQDLDFVFQELRKRCKKSIFLVVMSNARSTTKTFNNGIPKQATLKTKEWWHEKFNNSANWSGISQYWKWRDDGITPDEMLKPIMV